MHWLPILGFVLLGGLFLYEALRRGASRTWSWGRGGNAAPLSRAAYSVWGITLLCIAWVLTQAPQPAPLAALALLGCLIAIVVVAIADTRVRCRPHGPRH